MLAWLNSFSEKMESANFQGHSLRNFWLNFMERYQAHAWESPIVSIWITMVKLKEYSNLALASQWHFWIHATDYTSRVYPLWLRESGDHLSYRFWFVSDSLCRHIKDESLPGSCRGHGNWSALCQHANNFGGEVSELHEMYPLSGLILGIFKNY